MKRMIIIGAILLAGTATAVVVAKNNCNGNCEPCPAGICTKGACSKPGEPCPMKDCCKN